MKKFRIHGSTKNKLYLFLAVVALGMLLTPVPISSAAPQERHFRIVAKSFEYSPGTIRVNQGDRVTIDLVSKDVVHGLYLDGYGLEVAADPGQTQRLSFVADRSGSFRFRCSVTCGALHPFMIGKLEVGTNWLFWKSAGLAVLAVLAGIWSVVR